MISSWDAYVVNVAGLEHLLGLRGGITALKWQCFFRTHMTWAHLRAIGPAVSGRSVYLNKGLCRPEYPSLPYQPNLCLAISHLPVGYTDIALASGLCVEVIDFLASARVWADQFDPHAAECYQTREYYKQGLLLISRLADTMVKLALKPAERILCRGVFAYINLTDGRRAKFRQPRGLEDLLVGIEDISRQLKSMDDAMLWAAMAIAANNDNISWKAEGRWTLLDRYMSRPRTITERGDVRNKMQMFFWTPALEKQWCKCWETGLQRRREHRTIMPSKRIHETAESR